MRSIYANMRTRVVFTGFKRRGLSNAGGNTALIASNPCDGVKPLPKEVKKTGIWQAPFHGLAGRRKKRLPACADKISGA
jgi:hypothetical protein